MSDKLPAEVEEALAAFGDTRFTYSKALDMARLAVAKAIRDAELRMRERCYEVAHHIYMERVLSEPFIEAEGGKAGANKAKASEALRIRDAIRRLEPEGGK